MNNYKRIIFDIDYTLLIPDWSCENEYLKTIVPPEKYEEFQSKKQNILNEYELNESKYSYESLSKYFQKYGFNITSKDIEGWVLYNGAYIVDKLPLKVKEFLKYLKENNIIIVILSNWFSATQIPRLQKNGLYEYIDKIICGDTITKNTNEAFEMAIGSTPKEKCLMVGDSPRNDGQGAQRVGIDFYLVDENNTIEDLYCSIVNNKKIRIRKANENKQ